MPSQIEVQNWEEMYTKELFYNNILGKFYVFNESFKELFKHIFSFIMLL